MPHPPGVVVVMIICRIVGGHKLIVDRDSFTFLNKRGTQYDDLSALSEWHGSCSQRHMPMKLMDPETNIYRTLLVDASPEAVWRALTEPELTKLYMGAMIQGDLVPGKKIEWLFREENKEPLLVSKGTVMAVQPGERLRYTTYSPGSKLPDEPASHTTVDLHLIPEDGHTRVELWQGDFAGLPLAVRRTREVGKLWVEKLVGLKRVAEEIAQAKAA